MRGILTSTLSDLAKGLYPAGQGATFGISQALGHGQLDELHDIIYVHPGQFDGAKTQAMADEIGDINRRLLAENTPFLLIGPGRWGSSDPWLGIPVQWADISGVAAIIEVRNSVIKADASQGTHFFQNITSLGIPYLTLDESNKREADEDYLQWEWLQQQEVVTRGAYVHHVRSRKPLVVKCDGTRSESVIFEKINECSDTCEVAGRKVWNQKSIFNGEC